VCTDAGAVGEDSLEVTVTDATDTSRSLPVTISIDILDEAPGSDCDPDAFEDEGGCCDTGPGRGRGVLSAVPLSVLVLAGLRRRRSRR
jgi:hypothetical protein